jgi:hypothetical protein
MDFIEDIWVSQECTETGFGAKIDRRSAIFDTREIGRIRVAEFSPAEGDKTGVFLLIQRMFSHLKNNNNQVAVRCKDGDLRRVKLFRLLNFSDEDLKGTDN